MADCSSVLDGHIIPGEPLVSVSVITYNHGKYIRQCLDGILMQKVNFPYEVLVHDDASPDDTADIIREYEARFPAVIKPIYQTDNQYSQGKDISKFNFDRAKGKYIAYCEGDDYWTDSRKLQMQVDFLEEHEEYIGTAHNCRVIDENGNDKKFEYFSPFKEYTYTLDYYDQTQKIPGQLATWVHRNLFISLEKNVLEAFYACNTNGDNKLALLLVLNGNIYCFEKYMSVYRNITSFGTSYNARIQGTNCARDSQKKWLSLCDFAEIYYSKILSGFKKAASPSLVWPTYYLLTHKNNVKENLRILIQVLIYSPNKSEMTKKTTKSFFKNIRKIVKELTVL